ncbi:MAG: energy-coupling factor ABC transporter permease [Gammaproteobacteria bacterium]
MHIEPGLVAAGKAWLGYATATGVVGYTLVHAWQALRAHGPAALVARTVATTVLVLCFFELLPHRPVGVSEVHFVLGSTLLLLFGVVPAALGLALGLLVQGLAFAPFDLPQYGMNVTTLLIPLFVIGALSRRLIRPDTPYVDVSYRQALALSTTYQAGIVAWVAFWAFYGSGFSAGNTAAVLTFSSAYAVVILVEPLVDLAVLALAKAFAPLRNAGLLEARLYRPDTT